LGRQFGNHFFEGWKFAAVYRERSVFVLVVDVEINRIDRNLFVPECFCDLIHPRFRFVAITRLLEAQRPQRREFGTAHQRSELLSDFLWRWSGKEVVVDLSAFRPERVGVLVFLAKVEASAPGVVEKNSIRQAFAQSNEKRNGLIERVCRFLPAE